MFYAKNKIDKGQEKINHLKDFEGDHIHGLDTDQGDIVKKVTRLLYII